MTYRYSDIVTYRYISKVIWLGTWAAKISDFYCWQSNPWWPKAWWVATILCCYIYAPPPSGARMGDHLQDPTSWDKGRVFWINFFQHPRSCIPHICHLHHLWDRGQKMVMWKNFRFQYMTDVEKSEISPHKEEFQIFHTTDMEKYEVLPILKEF